MDGGIVCDGLEIKRVMMRGRWLVAPSDCKHTKPGFCPRPRPRSRPCTCLTFDQAMNSTVNSAVEREL